VAAEPECAVAGIYRRAARHLAARLWERSSSAGAGPRISMSDD